LRKKSTGAALFSGKADLWFGLVCQIQGVFCLVGVVVIVLMRVSVTMRVRFAVIVPVHLAVFMGMPFTRI
jgi:hypothetical protein